MGNKKNGVFNFLTFDLEDWFHILDLRDSNIAPSDWNTLPSRLEQNAGRILGFLSEHKVLATFFVLGSIGERYSAVVKEIDSAGHEIACHGYGHDLIYDLSPERFREDIRRARKVLEDLIGKAVEGYRGPGFSITPDNLWAFDVVAEEGFRYDATVYPGIHSHGGVPFLPSRPFTLITLGGYRINEFPATVLGLRGYRISFSGGGYFRLFPFFIITRLIDLYNRRGAPVMTYFHPRDFDPQTPRLSMPWKRRFKCYVNVSRSYEKLGAMLDRHTFGSVIDWSDKNVALPIVSLPELIGANT